jgi:15-cis-phytoene synthase
LNPTDGSLQQKTSFYFPFLLLPKEKRAALEALYRFCWVADEIADSPGNLPAKKAELSALRRGLDLRLAGKPSIPPFDPILGPLGKAGLSREPLTRVLKGVQMDLAPVAFKTFSQLHRYALLVAGGPGLASMEIFGFKDAKHRSYAEDLGVFLQVVNMVRDFKEDLATGRRYLPLEDFKRFHLDPSHIEERNSHWKPFVEFQLDRAWGFLEKARSSLSHQERSALPTAEAIAAVYVKLHQKLRNHPSWILQGKVSLSPWDKALSTLGAWGRCWLWRRNA